MSFTETVCPHCGYDFPPPPERPGFINSLAGDALLLAGMIVCGLVSLVVAIRWMFATLYGNWPESLVYLPLLLILSLALLVVFGRSLSK